MGREPGPRSTRAGRIVMVVREGSGWVLLQDGTRENLTATNVVARDPGGGGYLLPGSALTLGRIGQQPRAGRRWPAVPRRGGREGALAWRAAWTAAAVCVSARGLS